MPQFARGESTTSAAPASHSASATQRCAHDDSASRCEFKSATIASVCRDAALFVQRANSISPRLLGRNFDEAAGGLFAHRRNCRIELCKAAHFARSSLTGSGIRVGWSTRTRNAARPAARRSQMIQAFDVHHRTHSSGSRSMNSGVDSAARRRTSLDQPELHQPAIQPRPRHAEQRRPLRFCCRRPGRVPRTIASRSIRASSSSSTIRSGCLRTRAAACERVMNHGRQIGRRDFVRSRRPRGQPRSTSRSWSNSPGQL